jgi:hypothetical protein
LNNAVYDVKTKTMPQTAKESFVHREKNFFKANSTFKKADGLDVNRMVASVGFTPRNVKKNQSVEDLEQQEKGGKIGGRSFIPLRGARVSSSPNKVVKANVRTTAINNLLKTKNAKGKTKGQRFIKTVVEAKKTGALFLNDNTVFRVDRITKGMKFSLTPIYSYRKDRSVKVDSTKFMEKASVQSAESMPKFFYDNAKKEYERFRK